MRTRLAIALALVCCCQAAVPVQRGKQDIRMIILPVDNASGAHADDQIAQSALARAVLLSAFRERGFEVVGSTQVVASIEQLKLDISSCEKWTAEAMQELGKRWKAQYIAGVQIKSSGERQEGESRFAHLSASGWLFDVKEGTFVFQGVEGKPSPGSQTASSPVTAGFTSAVQAPFQEFLAKYPKRKPEKPKPPM
jgi:hypothetical protein